MFEEGNRVAIYKMKTTTFQDTDYIKWKEVAVKSLRGLPFEKLLTKTVEGIDLQPLYTKDNEKTVASIATIRSAKEKNDWIVAQHQYAENGHTFLAALKSSLERGNEAIVYDGKIRTLTWDKESLKALARMAILHPVYIENVTKKDPILEVFNLIPTSERSMVKGAVSSIGEVLPEGYTNVRTLGADIRPAHYDGADAVTELALAIAEAAELALTYESFKEFSNQFFVHFAVDTHFFMEIAKIRAFRQLWHALGTAFDESEASPISVYCDTSLRTYSKLDPYVNLLRAGNETFSAVLGGADVITVHPHDVLTGTTPAAIRYARNVQLVIKEETLVNEVIDPAGGSYFIETLTAELVEKAWHLFIAIDSSGGYKAYVDSGKLEERLQALRLAHVKEVSKGSKSLIGTNIYADLDTPFLKGTGGIEVSRRLAEPFEKLSAYFSENQPKTVLLMFGDLKEFKPYADFVSGFLATGGIQSIWSPAFTNISTAIEWLQKEQPHYIIVCAKPAVIEGMMTDLLENLPGNMIIDVAGKYDEKVSDNWIVAGLDGFIFNGQNKITKLTDIKRRWEGEKAIEKA